MPARDGSRPGASAARKASARAEAALSGADQHEPVERFQGKAGGFSRAQLATVRVQRATSHLELSQAHADSDHAGHAFLHDFCMTIPYGAAATAAGGISYVLGAGLIGMTAAAAGVMVCLASYLSLQAWRQGEKSTTYTLISAGGWLVRAGAGQPASQLLLLGAAPESRRRSAVRSPQGCTVPRSRMRAGDVRAISVLARSQHRLHRPARRGSSPLGSSCAQSQSSCHDHRCPRHPRPPQPFLAHPTPPPNAQAARRAWRT